jgi:hypothetical protein
MGRAFLFSLAVLVTPTHYVYLDLRHITDHYADDTFINQRSTPRDAGLGFPATFLLWQFIIHFTAMHETNERPHVLSVAC